MQRADGCLRGVDFGDNAQIVGDNEITGTDTSGHFCGESNNDGQAQQYTVHFDITSNQVIEAKVGISYVSTANARLDWQTENPGWDFDSAKNTAQQSWNSLLGRIWARMPRRTR